MFSASAVRPVYLYILRHCRERGKYHFSWQSGKCQISESVIIVRTYTSHCQFRLLHGSRQKINGGKQSKSFIIIRSSRSVKGSQLSTDNKQYCHNSHGQTSLLHDIITLSTVRRTLYFLWTSPTVFQLRARCDRRVDECVDNTAVDIPHARHKHLAFPSVSEFFTLTSATSACRPTGKSDRHVNWRHDTSLSFGSTAGRYTAVTLAGPASQPVPCRLLYHPPLVSCSSHCLVHRLLAVYTASLSAQPLGLPRSTTSFNVYTPTAFHFPMTTATVMLHRMWLQADNASYKRRDGSRRQPTVCLALSGH